MLLNLTEIKQTKKHRYALFIEGEFAFSVDEETLFKFHLEAKRAISQEELDEIREESDYRYGREKALSLLSYKDYTKKELFLKLSRLIDQSVAQRVCDRMEELSLIDDESYANRYARDLFNIKHLSPNMIERELYKKGLSQDLIINAVSQFEDNDLEPTLASFVLKKYSHKLGDEKGIKSLTGILLRRGYSYEQIKAVISNLTLDINYYDNY